jgi:hypothetical protein
MQSITLSYPAAIGGLVLVLALSASDVWLTHSVRRQKSALDSFASREAQTPAPSTPLATGEILPTLAGRSLTTGENFSVIPVSTKVMVVLVFRESCHFCEANWKNWETLFGNGSNTVPVVFLSGDTAVSSSYRQKHPLLDKHISVIGMNPDVMSSLNLDATPETLLVVKGKVKQDWVGVLSDKRVKEIQQALADEATQKL